MCTHVETPVTVWLQIVSDDNTKKIFNITEQLTALCPAAPKLTGQPDTNKVSQSHSVLVQSSHGVGLQSMSIMYFLVILTLCLIWFNNV